jgi:hypothetical protein
LSNVEQKNIVPGIDLTQGQFEVLLDEAKITVGGPAKLNGTASTLTLVRSRDGTSASTTIKTVLDRKTQTRLGLDMAAFAEGDLPITITAPNGLLSTAEVEADLSNVAMKVDALGWQREPTKGTKLTMRVEKSGNGRKFTDLQVSGPGISVKGEIEVGSSNQLVLANLSDLKLGDDYRFSARIEPSSKAVKVTVKGTEFDARPFIKAAVSPVRAGGGKASLAGQSYVIEAEFGRVTANRGEILENVLASVVTGQSTVQAGTIQGRFLSGQPIAIEIAPARTGRQVKVTSTDGGSTLRAANFYGKIAGGELEFSAEFGNEPGSPVRGGKLQIRNFEVRDEAALAELDKRGKPKKSGPRRDGIAFKRLTIPFSSDGTYYQLPAIELRGNDIGAVAKGAILKADGAMCITGTYIPAQGLTRWLGDVPLFGILLTGGNNEGTFGITFAMGGTISKPKYQINPISLLAPGFTRKLFEFQGLRECQERYRQQSTNGKKTATTPSILD